MSVISRKQLALSRLTSHIFDWLREVVAVVQQVHAAGAAGQQPCHERHVRLLTVALHTREDQVVGPVVRGLPATRPDVVQRDAIGPGRYATIGADRAVLFKQPFAMLRVGPAT